MLKQLLPSPDGGFVPRMNWKQWLCLFILTVTITALALIRLGYGADHVPQTSWQPSSIGEFVIVDFGEPVDLRTMLFFNGHPDNEPFMVAVSEEGHSWQTVHTSRGTYAPYQWGRIFFPNNTIARYVEFRPFGTSDLQFYEIGFRDTNGYLIPIAGFRRGSEGAERLFDEQHLVPIHPHFLLGIYFDEAHHVRTARDYVHGNPATEWTHPPMGKNFIATGIAIIRK